MRSQFKVLISIAAIGTAALAYQYTVSNSISAVEPAVLQRQIDTSSAKFVGRTRCIVCHAKENELWTGSHHDLAMQLAESETVLGNFDNATFDYYGIVSTFYKKDDRFFVNTDGPDGKLSDYEIKYVFGVTPLQQYLVAFPGGRLQTLPIAWDTRSPEEGGQSWFHLYADEKITHGDELHWSGINQNWNYMCAECHSTNLQKNFSIDDKTYHTTWSEMDVSCEACHGPASVHVELAGALSKEELEQIPLSGLLIDFPGTTPGEWSFPADASIAELQSQRSSTKLIETCARCHSRRISLNPEKPYLKSLYDTHLVSILDQDLYYADGQVDAEVYVYGSFIQSKMYRAGVSCNDCHNVHSLQLLAKGNGLCLQCHRQNKYDVQTHHFHPLNSAGAQCVSCHMPAKKFMVIDNRHDHSFRIPRPDLSMTTASPNACNQCHSDQSAQWALTQIEQWYGKKKHDFHYGQAVYAGRRGAENAEALLLLLAQDGQQPAIARATAMALLRNYPGPETLNIIRTGLSSEDPLIRLSSLQALDVLAVEDRYPLASSLLSDPLMSVRIHAASTLAAVPRSGLNPKQRKQLDKAIAEYIAVQKGNGDRAFAHVNLGNLYLDLGQYREAEMAFKQAIELERAYLPAFVNLADLYRLQNREEQVEATLQVALSANAGAPMLQYALGLSLVRQKRYDEALTRLQAAALAEPANPQYNLVYAIALNSMGAAEKALAVLEAAHRQRPDNQQLLMPLITINQERGNLPAAITYAEKLLTLSPDNASVRHFLEQLKR